MEAYLSKSWITQNNAMQLWKYETDLYVDMERSQSA